MKKQLLPRILLLVILAAALLSSCSGGVVANTSWPGLAVDENTAYLAYGQHIYAINLSNGTEKWRFPAEADAKVSFFSNPVLTEDGQLLAGSYDFQLYSLNPVNGTVRWLFTRSKDHLIASPLATQELIFQPSSDHFLYALDLQGNFKWSFETPQPLWAQPATDTSCECVYQAGMDHKVYSLNAQSGAQKWVSEDLDGAIVGTPAYGPDGTLYVGTFGSEIIALNAENGKVRWRFSSQGWVWGGPIYHEGVLYFGDLEGVFYAVDASNGSERWRLNPGTGAITGAPAILDGKISFTTELDYLYTVDEQGNPAWSKALGGKLHSTPVVSGDVILVTLLESDQLLVALDTEGTQRWSFTPAR
jgi:outer membrane protein assembly factor BamB